MIMSDDAKLRPEIVAGLQKIFDEHGMECDIEIEIGPDGDVICTPIVEGQELATTPKQEWALEFCLERVLDIRNKTQT